MNKKTIKDCILIDCISFTIVAVTIATLAYIPNTAMTITSSTYLQLFGCTTLVSVLMYFTSKIRIESQIVENLILLFDIASVVFCVGGGVFKWFPWEIKYVVIITAILTMVFFVTNFIMVWQNNAMAKAINEKIEAHKNE